MANEIVLSRNKQIDVMRGIGIFLVVLGHTYHNSGMLYLFHMPLFIMLSGYLYRVSDLKKTIKNKVVRLWVPFVAFNTFLRFFKSFFETSLHLRKCRYN